MNLKRIETALLGAITLLMGWGVGTLFHEGCHLAGACACGVPAEIESLTISSGLVILYGDLTATQTIIIALAGSLGLVIAGVLLVWLSAAPVVRMIGVVFLCRAWVDVLPITGYDGGLIAGSAGYLIAVLILIVEVLVCGGVILNIINSKEVI